MIGQTFNVKKLVPHAILPSKAHLGDLGYDLYSAELVMLDPGETKLISTGIAVNFPEKYGGVIKDRSSMASKRFLFIKAGVIDNGYSGPLGVLMTNGGTVTQAIAAGDKIAQIILIPVVNFPVIEVEELEDRDRRGVRGFGSTGSR